MDQGGLIEKDKYLCHKRDIEKIFKDNSILPYNIKKHITLTFLNEKYELLPQNYNFKTINQNKINQDIYTHNQHWNSITNLTNQLIVTNPNPIVEVLKDEEMTPEEKLSKLVNERNEIIKEIENIKSEIQVFEQREKRDRMILMMEKIADNIKEDEFEIDDLHDYYLFGEKMSDIETKYLENMKKISKSNNKIFSNSKKKDDKLFVTKNYKVFDFNKLLLRLKKNNKIKIKKRKTKKFKRSCLSCFIADENLSFCDNCTAAYHTFCESFKAIYVIEQKLTIVICNECFCLYKENNKLLNEQSSLYDNCEFQIRNSNLKLKFKCPKFFNLDILSNENKVEVNEEITVLAKNLFKFYQK